MSKHIFKLRLTASYESPENNIAAMDTQILSENGWEPLDLDTMTPGFVIYVYAMLTCQHLFLRTNATERDLVLAASQGEILVEASEDWLLEKIDVQFNVNLAAGNANAETIEDIVSRMKQCPVSKNLPQNINIQTRVYLDID